MVTRSQPRQGALVLCCLLIGGNAFVNASSTDDWEEEYVLQTLQSSESWTDVTVEPPPTTCWETWTSNAVCNPLDTAVKAAGDYTRIHVSVGEYRNKGYSETSPRTADFHNSWIIDIKKKKGLIIQAAEGGTPILKFDGSGGISIKDSHYVTIKGLEIQGPSNRITGVEATNERARLTSRSLTGETTGKCSSSECSSCTHDECDETAHCEYDSKYSYCKGKTLGYFNGRGIAVWAGTTGSSNIELTELSVHHCPASGIRANKGDEVHITKNVVYDNIWWTTSGESAIVFAESAGTGTNSINDNVVYGNRNFIPFYSPSLTDLPGQTGSKIGHYASWNQDYIIDGSGVYISRNQNYQGTFKLEDNTCFDNGINGVVVHNTDNAKVSVIVKGNIIFGNGRTTKDIESRQSAGGFTINSGNNVQLTDNRVATQAGIEGDYAYQCFNTCNIVKGSNNEACQPTNVNKKYADFVSETSQCDIDKDAIRAKYTASTMPNAPQYTKWCVECDNKRPEYLKTNNLWCSDFIDNNAKRKDKLCNNSPNWIKNKYCRESCYAKQMGYDNDQCC